MKLLVAFWSASRNFLFPFSRFLLCFQFLYFFFFFFFLTAFLSRGSCMLWLTTSPRWLSAAMVCSVQSSSSSSCCSLSSSPSLSASGGWTNSWAFSCLGFISCSWLSASSWRTKWSSVLSPSSGKCWFLRKKKKVIDVYLFSIYIYIEMKWNGKKKKREKKKKKKATMEKNCKCPTLQF